MPFMSTVLNIILLTLALLSFLLLLWQWAVARRFPLHRRRQTHSFPPAACLLKPLKGCDAFTESCLRSWLQQDYTGRIQVLFGVASAADPVCAVVRKLQEEFPGCDCQLVVCESSSGANAKVSKLVQLAARATHEILVISDADVRVPPDFLSQTIEVLREPEVGLVHCLYQLANPYNLAMRWEGVAINADFWSQVLQARSLKPLDFALGAGMAVHRKQLEEIGGFEALVDCLADDYQLGNRIARQGHRVELSPIVVDCLSAPMNWWTVWKHQLRWARTIRVCQPAPYFFSILSNASLWPLLWALLSATPLAWLGAGAGVIVRMLMALDCQWKLTRSRDHFRFFWLAPLKDLLQAVLWVCAFAGNRIEWRGEKLRLRGDGKLVRG